MTTSDEFLTALRSTLNHLYDPDRLRQSPLAGVFGVAGRFDAPSALQDTLITAIESLRPNDSSSAAAEAWITYEVLVYRYVQQLSQQAVADQLGFNVRHLRRKQRAAIETLAWHLWQQYDLADTVSSEGDSVSSEGDGVSSEGEFVSYGEAVGSAESAVSAETTDPTGATGTAEEVCPDYAVADELAWLEEARPTTLTNTRSALRTVLDRAKPLADQAGVVLRARVDDALPSLRVHAVALRQIVLNTLCLAIHRCAGGTIEMEAGRTGDEVLVTIHGTCRGALHVTVPQSDVDALRLARRMTEVSGGALSVIVDEQTFVARLGFPMPQRTPILALDDNRDFLQLLDRYVADTRYRIVATRDPDRALQLAEELVPGAILLDVMMPDVDGWEVLARLRQHPATEQIPIIVCTILPQQDLAVSLGANGFLRKPLSQEALLATLDAQLGPRAQGAH